MSGVGIDAHDAPRARRWATWMGWGISVAPVLIILSSARWKLTFDPWYVQEWERIGWTTDALPRIGLLQLACLVLYVIPRTSVLGAVLLTGYMGGAIASYVRIGELVPPLVPLTTALLAWAGIYVREERLRSVLPFRRNTPNPS
jgi:hypothetical protein